MIKHGGFPLNVFRTLFESCVCSVSDYGGEIWGYKSYESNRQLLLKAGRSYLGVPKQTAIPGLLSEINWPEPRSRTQIQMLRHFHRLVKMNDERLMKKVYLWDRQLNDEGVLKTWSSEIQDILQRNGLIEIYTKSKFTKKKVSNLWRGHCSKKIKLTGILSACNYQN